MIKLEPDVSHRRLTPGKSGVGLPLTLFCGKNFAVRVSYLPNTALLNLVKSETELLEKMHLKLVTISAWRKKVLGNG
jgi:hypothetical protein